MKKSTVLTMVAALLGLLVLGWLISCGENQTTTTANNPVEPHRLAKEALDAPTLSCVSSTQTTITVRVCAGESGAPAGFSLQWKKPDESEFSCDASFSGQPGESIFSLDPGQCIDIEVAVPTGETGETFHCTDDLECGTEYVFRAFAHAEGGPDGLGRSDFSDEITCSTEPCQQEEQGCTPGYWKNHTGAWEGYLSSDKVGDVFDIPSCLDDCSIDFANSSLLDALRFRGGSGACGKAQILLRAAVAALLNAAHSGVDYPRSEGDIISDVNDALAGCDPDEMVNLAGALDADNNLGCPLN